MSTQMETIIQEIGHVTTSFDKSGKLIGAEFWPSIKAVADDALMDQFNKLTIHQALPIRIRQAGEALISRFFSNATNIELADQEKYFIDSEVVKCDKYRNGVVKSCSVKYFLRSRRA